MRSPPGLRSHAGCGGRAARGASLDHAEKSTHGRLGGAWRGSLMSLRCDVAATEVGSKRRSVTGSGVSGWWRVLLIAAGTSGRTRPSHSSGRRCSGLATGGGGAALPGPAYCAALPGPACCAALASSRDGSGMTTRPGASEARLPDAGTGSGDT